MINSIVVIWISNSILDLFDLGLQFIHGFTLSPSSYEKFSDLFKWYIMFRFQGIRNIFVQLESYSSWIPAFHSNACYNSYNSYRSCSTNGGGNEEKTKVVQTVKMPFLTIYNIYE